MIRSLVGATLLATASAITCKVSAPVGCYNNTPHPVPDLWDEADTSMIQEHCGFICAGVGAPWAAVTGNTKDGGFCYCGSSVSPNSPKVDDSYCNVPCPGDKSSMCGGVGYSLLMQVSCDGPLPPAVDPTPLPAGPPCSHAQTRDLPFCNVSLPLETRVQDLVGRISVTEIGPQLTSRQSPPIPRLGIPDFYWGSNAIHGIVGLPCVKASDGSMRCPTSFPDGLGMAASYNLSAARVMGAVIGRELRATTNIGVASWAGVPTTGLVAWSPTINVARDPRFGRTQETAGEDIWLAGRYGAAVCRGNQEGEDPRYLMSACTIKHMLAYSLEQYTDPRVNMTWMRQDFNAIISPFDLADSYMHHFEYAVRPVNSTGGGGSSGGGGGAAGIMYAVNEINGVPGCADTTLLSYLQQWGMDGYRSTDGGQIINMIDGHHYPPAGNDLRAAIALAVAAQSDIADGPEYQQRLVDAVYAGFTTEEGARTLLANTLRIRFRLGLFDYNDPTPSPYTQYNADDVNDATAQAANALAARQALVLLQNHNATLPFPDPADATTVPYTVAVIGPNSNSTHVLQGNYGEPDYCPSGNDDCYPNIYQSIAAILPSTTLTLGSYISNTSSAMLSAAAAAAAAADRVVLVLGLDQTQEGEQLDRYNMTLPDAQQQLYATVRAAAAGKPLVVILIHGGALAIEEVKDTADAILTGHYPGVVAGPGIADAIFGRYNPGGRTVYTWYPASYQDAVNFTWMNMSTSDPAVFPGRTYRYYQGPAPLWPCFFGLSYTTFSLALSGPPPPQPIILQAGNASSTVSVSVTVSNTGGMDGDDVLFAFFAPVSLTITPPATPIRQLMWAERVAVPAGATSAPLTIPLAAADFTLTQDAAGTRGPIPGTYNLILSRGIGVGTEITLPVQIMA